MPGIQEAIYDERFAGDAYDDRSAVHVLTAEMSALQGAVDRAAVSLSNNPVLSILDWGYGTGRVTNEFMISYPGLRGNKREVRVVAYDVSRVGLEKAMHNLRTQGFDEQGQIAHPKQVTKGYIAGSFRRVMKDTTITCCFVHGHEEDTPDMIKNLLTEANNGESFSVTSSWYSGIGHMPGAARRQSTFKLLGDLTHPQGEIVVTTSATGDWVDGWQDIWQERLAQGYVGETPVCEPGDMMYETEIAGLFNFYHVYSTDLEECLEATHTDDGQKHWVEAIRFPDPEFVSQTEEQANYQQVVAFNQSIRGRLWTPDDYRQVHTVGGFRSSVDPTDINVT